MIIVVSVRGIPVRLTKARWSHIILRHPEMDNQKERVLATLSTPDLVQEGDYGTLIALRFFEESPLTSKYLAVVYKEISPLDSFVLTAYFTNRPSERRRVAWKR